MKAVDTNALVRYLTNDDAHQAALVKNFFDAAKHADESILISNLVLLELIRVLHTSHGFNRSQILLAFHTLLQIDFFEFENLTLIQKWYEIAEQDSIDLPDLLIGLAAQAAGADAVLTFDQRSAKSTLFELLK